MKKNVKIITNPLLLFSGLICVIITSGMGFAFTILIYNGTIHAASETDKIGCALILGFLGLAMIGAGLLCLPQWLVVITLTDTEVRYRAAFKKAVKKQYKNFPYVSKAWYKHRGLLPIGYNAYYIVLSEGRLSGDEQKHINQISISDSVIKIRYRKKVYEKLLEILPEKQKTQLIKSFSEDT